MDNHFNRFPEQETNEKKIMKKNLFFLLPLFLAFVSLSNRGNAQGTLVFNGGFDSNAAGWIVANVNRLGGWYPGKGNPGGYFFLDAVPSSLDPTISQTIKGFVPGLTYMVSVDFAFSDDSGDPGVTLSFGVAFNGVFVFQTAKPTSSDWQTVGFFYTPSFSDEIISISAQLNGTAVSYGIDNVVIQLIPEPSSTALFVLGGAFILCCRWRKD